MTSPTLIYRELTVAFARSVNADQQPQTVQVVVIPLETTTSAPAGATFVEAPATQDILLAQQTNTVTFRLVPSDLAGLTERVLYRIAWRVGGLTGRTYTYDFAMPDFDVSFEQLTSLNAIIDGQVYLQQSDLGVAGRVARLNDDGDVVDADGIPVAGQAAVNGVQAALNTEIANRTQADTALSNQLQSSIVSYYNQAVTGAANDLTAARNELLGQIATINTATGSLVTTTTANQTAIANLTDAVDAANADLLTKADLVGGLVPLAQLPVGLLRQGVTVADEAAMLALTSAQISQFEVASRPDGVWMLVGTNRAQLGSWLKLNPVATVNGQTGAVVLSLTDVAGAGGSVPQGQVSGLADALTAKASASDLTAVTTRVGDTESQIIGLSTTLTGHDSRLGSLEGRVTTLEAGAGIGEGVVANLNPVPWWSADDATGDFAADVTLRSPFGYNPTNPASNAEGYYFDPDGADVSEVRFPYITPNGHLELRQWNENGPADPVLATAADLSALTTVVNGKANQFDLTALTSTVADKANQSEVDDLTTTVSSKASQSAVDTLGLTVATKASQTDLDALSDVVDTKAAQSALDAAVTTVTDHTTTLAAKADLVDGTVPVEQLPALPQSKITDLASALATKADLVAGTVPVAQLPTAIPQSSVTNLTSALAAKADLVDGKLATSQLPSLALSSVTAVADRTALLALTDVQPGDMGIITSGADQGTYILTAADPSVFANWTLAVAPTDAVTSVNGQTGTVNLTAAQVGALATDAVLPQSQVADLTTDLASKLSSSELTTALNNRVTWSATAGDNPALETVLSGAAPVKRRATYVRTTNLLTLSGNQQRSDDGSGDLMAVGSTVLLTAQISSVNNGLWLVNAGAWTRVSDMAAGSYLLSGTLVAVSSGSNADTLWQVTSGSGVVNTVANTWTKIGHLAAPYSPLGGDGITVTGTGSTPLITAEAAPSGGISVGSGGIAVDSSVVARKYASTVPGSATNTVTVTHNLNTRVVMVSVQAASTGVGVLVGWQATGLNTVELEFNSPPSSGVWSILVIG